MVQAGALGLDDPCRVRFTGDESDHQLNVELVALMFGGYAIRKPILQRVTPLAGDAINAPGRFLPFAKIRGGLYQPGFFESFEGGVDLRGFYIPILITDNRRERGMEFIAVAGFLCE